MAKIIKLTQECVEELKRDFAEALSSTKLSDGKISFSKTFGNINRKANVFFTELAWLKMQTLIREFDKEVAWHGIATRGENADKDEYYITDILVYPQEVTGATVNTDQEKYQMWLMSHEDDVFNNIRMQGHSHVNMGVTPSSVDTSLYDRILEQLDDDMFYIFMIWNKKGDKTVKIYDLAKNVLFETADCTVSVLDDGTGLEQFLKNAKDMVKDKTYTYKPSNVSGGYSYGGFTGATTPKKDEKNTKNDDKKLTNGKRKGKRKSDKKSTDSVMANAGTEDDDWRSYYGASGWQNNFDFWEDDWR